MKVLETKQIIVAVGGVTASATWRDYRINKAMEQLYCDGCRRLRVVRLPIASDYQRYKVMGWAA